jgi:hypothetical protein
VSTTYEELLRGHNVEYRLPGQHHHVRPGWVGTDCPYCSPGWQHFRLGYHEARRRFSCWVCGAKPFGETLSLLLGVPVRNAYRLVPGSERSDRCNFAVAADAKRGTLVMPDNLGPLRSPHRNYLKRRGFDPTVLVKTWDLEAVGVSHYLSWRIIIPIHDHKGEVVSWTARAVSDHVLRYISAKPSQEKVSHKNVLGGEHLAGHAVVVCEGPFDAFAVGPGAVWLTGLVWSMPQVWRIAQHPVRVVLFDNQDQAQQKADKLCRELSAFPGETVRVNLESAKDPGDAVRSHAGRAELAELRRRYLSDSAIGRQSCYDAIRDTFDTGLTPDTAGGRSSV